MPNLKVTPAMRQQRVIKSARAGKGLTQEKMAKKIGMTQSAYQHIEKDVSNAKFGCVCEICRILGIDIGMLIEIGKD